MDARAQQCICPLRTVLQRTQCTSRRSLGAKAMCCCFSDIAFFPHSSSKLSQDFNVVLLFHRSASRYPFNHDDAINIERKQST
ncbi:hypothetical protein TNCV_1786701 [Trichonephila clavipes]|nr:hypothetical protein TNCV_1786701 [Trichonephila clavipes]